MKKIVLLAGLALGLFSGFNSEAQVRVNIQMGGPVMQQGWYANDNDYYFMPDHGVYYNVRRDVYVYPQGGNWFYANRLPQRYGNVSYVNSRYYRVRERAPFTRNDYYRRQYMAHNGYRGGARYGDNDRRNNGRDRDWNDNRRDNRDGNYRYNDGGNSVHYNRR